MSENRDTTGVEFSKGEFVSTDTDSANITPDNPKFDDRGDYRDPRYLAHILEKLKENSSFAIFLISVVGYISIATFGEMDSNGKYFGYIFFLLFSISFYGLQDIEFKKIFEKINTFLLYSFLFLLFFIIIQNIDYIKLFFEYINIWK